MVVAAVLQTLKVRKQPAVTYDYLQLHGSAPCGVLQVAVVNMHVLPDSPVHIVIQLPSSMHWQPALRALLPRVEAWGKRMRDSAHFWPDQTTWT